MRNLAEAGVNFEAKLVNTLSDYVSALVKKKFALIIADERADAAEAGTDDLSVFEIAEQVSPGAVFILLCDRVDTAVESDLETSKRMHISRRDVHLIQRVLTRVGNDPQGKETDALDSLSSKV